MLIRRIVVPSGPHWARLSAPTKASLRAGLLSAIGKETCPAVARKVRDEFGEFPSSSVLTWARVPGTYVPWVDNLKILTTLKPGNTFENTNDIDSNTIIPRMFMLSSLLL